MEFINEITTPKKLSRSFGGKTEGFESKGEQRFEQKHLKAYLKGYQRFRFGYLVNGEVAWYKVNEIWS